jgi:hypothetical protein
LVQQEGVIHMTCGLTPEPEPGYPIFPNINSSIEELIKTPGCVSKRSHYKRQELWRHIDPVIALTKSVTTGTNTEDHPGTGSTNDVTVTVNEQTEGQTRSYRSNYIPTAGYRGKSRKFEKVYYPQALYAQSPVTNEDLEVELDANATHRPSERMFFFLDFRELFNHQVNDQNTSSTYAYNYKWPLIPDLAVNIKLTYFVKITDRKHLEIMTNRPKTNLSAYDDNILHSGSRQGQQMFNERQVADKQGVVVPNPNFDVSDLPTHEGGFVPPNEPVAYP